MTLYRQGLLPALTLGLALGLAAPSLAQTAAMPLPPSAGDPTPADGGGASKAKRATSAKKPAQARKKTVRPADESGLPEPGTARRSTKRGEPAFSDTSATAPKPRRFVPEEFDNGDDGNSARPIISPSGRAGLGMRF